MQQQVDAAPPCTLTYFASAWVQPVDVLILPQLRALLAQVNAELPVVRLLEVRRVDDADTTSNKDPAVQHLEPSAFRSLCQHYQVAELPAWVLLDTEGHPLVQGAVKALATQAAELSGSSTISSPAAWEALGKLVQDSRGFSVPWQVLQPLLRSTTTDTSSSDVPTPLNAEDPAMVQIRQDATALFEAGELIAAATSFVRALLHCPTCTKSSFNLAVILQTLGETYFAVSAMLRVVALDDSDSVAHTVLRSVYYLEEPDRVLAGYRAIIAASSDSNSHVRAVHSLATLEGDCTTTTAAPEYVAEVFDELAESFEEKLVAHLEYRVPWQLVDALKKLAPSGFAIPTETATAVCEPKWTVLDVGCGTGLCGRLLRPHVKHIVGVDISPLMIDKTRAGGSYDELETADIVPFLRSREDASLDLVISADVWIYVGALDEVFTLSARKLRPGTGWMAFSIELLPPSITSASGFRLAPSGRFQHSHAYIASLAERSGFSIVVQQGVDVRKESGEPIPGCIYQLQRTSQ